MFGRRLIAVALCGAAGLVFAACGGETNPATNVTSTSATLNAHASCQAGESGKWWFRWRPTGNPWRETPRNSYECATDDAQDVRATLTGLTPGTDYEFEICAKPTNPFVAVCANANGHGDNADRDPGAPVDSFHTPAATPPPPPSGSVVRSATPPPPPSGSVVRYATVSGFTTLASNPGCDFFASPTGSDSNAGTSPANAFRTVSKLDSVLSAGKVGCLESGDYGSSSTLLQLNMGGASGNPATLTADTGASPVIHGGVRIYAANLTLSGIKWDGTYLNSTSRGQYGCSSVVAQPLDIEASNVTFTHNDVTYANALPAQRPDGIGVAWNTTATGIQITYNKIHDFGSCNQYDHGIYYDFASNGVIANNWIYNGPCSYGQGGRDHTKGCGGGIQIYSGPNNNQVFNNVIDGAGVGCYCYGSGNNVYHNVFSNLRGIYYDDGGFAAPYVISAGGSGNSFHDNLRWNAGACSCDGSNINADPQYVDAANHNYAVKPSSPAASWGLWAGF